MSGIGKDDAACLEYISTVGDGQCHVGVLLDYKNGRALLIDVLYEFEEDAATLDHYVALQAMLEGLLGRRVDLVSKKYLNPILRQYIEDDIEVVMPAIS